MSHITSIVISDEIYFSDEFNKLKRTRGLSGLVNSLLKNHLNVKRQAVPDDNIGIDDELQQLNVRKALLLDKKAILEKAQAEENNRWRVIN